jgi:hypothetical protein
MFGLGSSPNSENNLIHNWCIGGCWFTKNTLGGLDIDSIRVCSILVFPTLTKAFAASQVELVKPEVSNQYKQLCPT